MRGRYLSTTDNVNNVYQLLGQQLTAFSVEPFKEQWCTNIDKQNSDNISELLYHNHSLYAGGQGIILRINPENGIITNEAKEFGLSLNPEMLIMNDKLLMLSKSRRNIDIYSLEDLALLDHIEQQF